MPDPDPPLLRNDSPGTFRAHAEPSLWQKIKSHLSQILVGFVVILKFAALFLKTGVTMILSIWVYAHFYGWPFAVGFVLMIFVHECGHLVLAKQFGLKVSAPMFIPFMGATIALKEAPKNAWMEAWVGIGGPIYGAAAALACHGLFIATGNPLYRALAYSGYFLNLFNLAPISPLDGGRIATAISPWLWLAGIVVIGAMLYLHPNVILLIIVIVSLPRLFSLFRARSDAEKRYFEVTPAQRWTMAVLYFGLVAALYTGMRLAYAPLN